MGTYLIKSRVTICQWWLHSSLTNVSTINAATIIAYKKGMQRELNEERKRECVQENREKERAAMAVALLPLQQL